MFLQVNLDTVGYVEVAGFADVLDAVDQFAGHPFGLQFGREGDVECHGEQAIAGYQPAGDVLGGDFKVFQVQVKAAAIDVEDVFICFFDGTDLGLAELADDFLRGLHVWPQAFAEGFEVGFDALFEQARIVGQVFNFLDVYF